MVEMVIVFAVGFLGYRLFVRFLVPLFKSWHRRQIEDIIDATCLITGKTREQLGEELRAEDLRNGK